MHTLFFCLLLMVISPLAHSAEDKESLLESKEPIGTSALLSQAWICKNGSDDERLRTLGSLLKEMREGDVAAVLEPSQWKYTSRSFDPFIKLAQTVDFVVDTMHQASPDALGNKPVQDAFFVIHKTKRTLSLLSAWEKRYRERKEWPVKGHTSLLSSLISYYASAANLPGLSERLKVASLDFSHFPLEYSKKPLNTPLTSSFQRLKIEGKFDSESEDSEPGSAPLLSEEERMSSALSLLLAGSQAALFLENSNASVWVVPFNPHHVYELLSQSKSKVKIDDILIGVNPGRFRANEHSWEAGFDKLGEKFNILVDLEKEESEPHSKTREGVFMARVSPLVRALFGACATQESIPSGENKEGHASVFSWQIAQYREKHRLFVGALVWPLPLTWQQEEITPVSPAVKVGSAVPKIMPESSPLVLQQPYVFCKYSPLGHIDFELSDVYMGLELHTQEMYFNFYGENNYSYWEFYDKNTSHQSYKYFGAPDRVTPQKVEGEEDSIRAEGEEEVSPSESVTPGAEAVEPDDPPIPWIIKEGEGDDHSYKGVVDGDNNPLPPYQTTFPKGYKGSPLPRLHPYKSLKSRRAPEGYDRVTFHEYNKKGEYMCVGERYEKK